MIARHLALVPPQDALRLGKFPVRLTGPEGRMPLSGVNLPPEGFYFP